MNRDGTLSAIITDNFVSVEEFGLLTVAIPGHDEEHMRAGRYFLARCGVQSEFERLHQWGIYFRRPLFIASCGHGRSQDTMSNAGDESNAGATTCQLLIPFSPFISSVSRSVGDSDAIYDPGYAWLAHLSPSSKVNLMGPFGNGFQLQPTTRNLLLLSTGARVGKLLPLIESILDQGGRVTLIILADSDHEHGILQMKILPLLPIAVELHMTYNHAEWQARLLDSLVWADQLCAAIPESDYAMLSLAIKEKRFHLQEGFAQIAVNADLVCGIGACLACIVSTAGGGHTRACINGPVFDLRNLVR